MDASNSVSAAIAVLTNNTPISHIAVFQNDPPLRATSVMHTTTDPKRVGVQECVVDPKERDAIRGREPNLVSCMVAFRGGHSPERERIDEVLPHSSMSKVNASDLVCCSKSMLCNATSW